ncbi:hypothetical protein [Gemmata sp.]|uniref:hypothetical protein n=1 Tax=Gemmata sp. TaxID=1914242 RepID=UPI003F7269EB
MTLHTMTIPDEPAELPRWLERQLVSPDFGRLVAELLAHFPSPPGDAPSQPLLDRWLSTAMRDGLGPVPAEVLSQLLRHPPTLAAFQERIALDGGPYWDSVLLQSDDLRDAFERGKLSLDRVLAADDTPPAATKQATRKASPKAVPKSVPSGQVKPSPGRGYKVWAFASTAVAACLVVAVGYLATRGPDEPALPKAQIAWGWGKPSGLALDQQSPKGYLNKLADSAEEWSAYQPSDATGVGTRVAELRIGCTRLMHSAYGPLTPADKAWLLEHCREWGRRLDGHQQALDAGSDPLVVRAAVDETVQLIAATLRAKAKQLG